MTLLQLGLRSWALHCRSVNSAIVNFAASLLVMLFRTFYEQCHIVILQVFKCHHWLVALITTHITNCWWREEIPHAIDMEDKRHNYRYGLYEWDNRIKPKTRFKKEVILVQLCGKSKEMMTVNSVGIVNWFTCQIYIWQRKKPYQRID